MGRKETGEGGVENFAERGHSRQPLTKNPSLDQLCPVRVHVPEEGEAGWRYVYLQRISFVSMSESYAQARKPLRLLS